MVKRFAILKISYALNTHMSHDALFEVRDRINLYINSINI